MPVSQPTPDPRVTERTNPRTTNIDLASPAEIVALMSAEDSAIASTVAAQAAPIADVIEQVALAFRTGGRLLYVGAGTSGRLGVLDASECPPTFGAEPGLVVGIIAGGDHALRNAVEGAEDSPEQGAQAMDTHGVCERDVLVGIAASGTTPFVHGALARAHALGAYTAFVACSPPPEHVLAWVNTPIVAITGPEVVTGSTRLKAGTATKMILNMITTGAFIRVGKTYGNRMVDLRASNAKLTDRSERIVMEVCDVSREEARCCRRQCAEHKYAIVMRTLRVDHDAAVARLDAEGGVIRRVLGT